MNIRKRTRKTKSGKAYVLWECDLGIINGKRVVTCFKSEEEAKDHLRNERDRLKNYGQKSYSFTPAEIQTIGRAIDTLKVSGMTLDDAVTNSIKIKKLTDAGVMFDQVVEFWVAHHGLELRSITLRAAIHEFIAEKRRLRRKEAYLAGTENILLSFALGREERTLEILTKAEIKEWITTNEWDPKTQRNYLGCISSLFSWAVGEGYLATNVLLRKPGQTKHPIELPEKEDAEITAFGPEVCEHLLHTALYAYGRKFNEKTRKYETVHKYRPLLGYLVLAMFCGIRPEALKKTPRECISLEGATIVVRGMYSKTKDRHVAQFPSENVGLWLSLWLSLCPSGDAIIPRNFRRLWEELREVAGVTPWPHDILRRTCASMHYAFFQDLAGVKALLDHSEDEETFKNHYRAVQTLDGRTITKKMADKFWNIFPPSRIAIDPLPPTPETVADDTEATARPEAEKPVKSKKIPKLTHEPPRKD